MSHAFLSYAPDDAGRVKPHAKALEAAGIKVWMDDTRIQPGQHLTPAVDGAIQAAACLVVFFSRAAADHPWVRQEVAMALERGAPVIPVRLDDLPYPVWWRERVGEQRAIDGQKDDAGGPEALVAGVSRLFARGCPVIALMNLKGGVGKTTVCAHVFSALQKERENRVLLIDLDPQYNLSQIFFQRTTVDTLGLMDSSVISLFEPSQLQGVESPGENWDFVNMTELAFPPLDQIARRLIPAEGGRGRLDVIVGQFEIAKYAFIEDPPQRAQARENFRKAIAALRAHYDFIVIDTNPSASFLTRCAIDVATRILAPVRADRLSLRGVRLLKKLLARILEEPAWPSVHLLLNGVERGAMTEFEEDLRSGRLDAEVKFQASRFTLRNRLFESQYLSVRPEGDASEPLRHLAIYRASGIWGGEIKRTLVNLAEEIWEMAESPAAG